MAPGDGIRRNIAHVSPAERDRFLAAVLQLDTNKFYPDGVSHWDKQEDIHKNAHAAGANVHVGPAFIPSPCGNANVALSHLPHFECLRTDESVRRSTCVRN
jgi:hypothetical protein